MSWEERVQALISVDILLLASGPTMALSLFLTPQSGVVEICPVNYRGYFYSRVAREMGVYYLAHYNFTSIPSTRLPPECLDVQDNMDESELCRSQMMTPHVYVPPITLWMMLVDMGNTVNHNKYHIYR